MTFDFYARITKFYTYRSAKLLATAWIILSDKEKQSLKWYLDKYGYKMDNHICWQMTDGSSFSYSDGRLGFGTKIIEGRY